MSDKFDKQNRQASRIFSAGLKNVDDIYDLLQPYIIKGQLLPRDKADIRKNIEAFLVAEYHGCSCGCVALKNYSGGLFEIRSLVVNKDYENLGIGSSLVNAAVEMAVEKKATRVFALTRRPNVFVNAGFTHVSREQFPEKIWNDCSKCLKFDCCDEIALQKVIDN